MFQIAVTQFMLEINLYIHFWIVTTFSIGVVKKIGDRGFIQQIIVSMMYQGTVLGDTLVNKIKVSAIRKFSQGRHAKTSKLLWYVRS